MELYAQVIAILEEVKTKTDSGASASSNSATSSATTKSVLNSILEKSGPNAYVCQDTCNASSGGIEGLDRDEDNIGKT